VFTLTRWSTNGCKK